MRICLVTPAPPGSRLGNRVTAERWARQLAALGHDVRVGQDWGGEACDLLIALHGVRSLPSIERFHTTMPDRPMVVVLTGTDIYGAASADGAAAACERATCVVVLQEAARERVPEPVRGKVRVIPQAADGVPLAGGADPGVFQVLVLAHLRAVKDPLRAAAAARLLPPESRIQVVHAGAALERGLAEQARDEQGRNLRYRWLGDLPRPMALHLLAQSRLLAITSRHEGGPAVLAEAIAAGVPVMASRIPAVLALLGTDYPGVFEVGDTRGLALGLRRAERDPEFYDGLRRRCAAQRPRVDPAAERRALESLLAELTP
jgi:putative glycosyltransferase (TIGR04348 family)